MEFSNDKGYLYISNILMEMLFNFIDQGEIEVDPIVKEEKCN